jgi:drug/metabolite transporter (DMT)-like permease
MTSPYLEPVTKLWARIAGIALLVAGAGLLAFLAYRGVDVVTDVESRRSLTSSSLIFGLILAALCGICWQAGYRLAFGRPDRTGTIFSRPAWFAIGAALVVLTALMAYVIFQARRPTLLDVQVMLFLGGIGVWCLVLAFRKGRWDRR